MGTIGLRQVDEARRFNPMNDLIPEAHISGTIDYHGVDLYDPHMDAVAAIDAKERHDADAATTVITDDEKLDHAHREITEMVSLTIATQQPVEDLDP